jgi:cysteine-rich repeat protein
MVTRSRERLLALAIGSEILGCNALAGIREGVFDPCVEDAGDPLCVNEGASASSSSSSSSSTSSSGGVSASASTSGTGGGRAKCGDGKLDDGEECDDKNTTADDGCTGCKVDCTEAKAFKDPSSAHCYWSLDAMSFFKGSVMCQSFPGGQLATVTSEAELALIASHLGGPAWVGASALGPTGMLAWLDGEPWGYVLWGPGEPSKESKDLCLLLEGEPLRFGMSDCTLAQGPLCERAPRVKP